MKTERLYLREQTREILLEVLKQSREEQNVFFGAESDDILDYELKKLKAKIKDNIVQNWVKWDLVLLDTGIVIGSCGFHNWQPIHERAEVGYLLREEYRKQGYMSEALRAVIQYGFQKMDLNRIEAFISPDNKPSVQVVKGLNFRYEGTLRQHYKSHDKIHDSAVYALLKSEYHVS